MMRRRSLRAARDGSPVIMGSMWETSGRAFMLRNRGIDLRVCTVPLQFPLLFQGDLFVVGAGVWEGIRNKEF
jgi:hypothetical protein